MGYLLAMGVSCFVWCCAEAYLQAARRTRDVERLDRADSARRALRGRLLDLARAKGRR